PRMRAAQAAAFARGGLCCGWDKGRVGARAARAEPPPAGARALHPAVGAAGDQARLASAAWPVSPAAAPLPADAAAPAGQPATAPADVTALLDEAFGAEPG